MPSFARLAFALLAFALVAFAFTAAGAPTGSDRDAACFSPYHDVDDAYTAGATGCACRPGIDPAACVADSDGTLVALICSDDGTWHAVVDGPCTPG